METTQTQQPSVMNAQPQEEHRWLEKLLGEWTFEGAADPEADPPVDAFSGKETVRSLGGLWFLAEGEGPMPDGTAARTVMTLGYDPARQRYVGTFIGSMMTHLWIYEGSIGESGRVLTLNTEGPDFQTPGKTAMYRDVIEFITDDHRTLTAFVQGEDGEWTQMMKAHYRRAG
jgi:hypothetical protein